MLEDKRQQEKDDTNEQKRVDHVYSTHRMKKIRVMGYARPQELVDSILYDIEAFEKMFKRKPRNEQFWLPYV